MTVAGFLMSRGGAEGGQTVTRELLSTVSGPNRGVMKSRLVTRNDGCFVAACQPQQSCLGSPLRDEEVSRMAMGASKELVLQSRRKTIMKQRLTVYAFS